MCAILLACDLPDGKVRRVRRVKSPVWYSATIQTLFLLSVSILFWLLWGKLVAKSYFIGGLICLIPNLYFVHYAFRYANTEQCHLAARSMVVGEMGKLGLSMLGFALVFSSDNVIDELSLFIGFISVLVSQWFIAQRITSFFDRKNEANNQEANNQ